MKKNAIIYIDDTHAQVTKAFEKQARIFGTPEYREWRAYRQDFPNAQMVSKTIKKAKNKRNDAKNRTYEKMAEYIRLQENADELMKEFEVAAEPIKRFLAEHYDPMCTAVISMDNIQIFRGELGEPIQNICCRCGAEVEEEMKG